SITNIPLTEQDLNMLYESIEFMKQFNGFSHFKELDGMVQKLEDHIYSQKTNSKSVIDFEKNENLKGLEFLDELYKAIINKKAILITYQSFKARQANSFDFHPYLLKEFRNRWFVIGIKKKNEGILNLALDRIIEIKESKKFLIESPDFNPDTHFENAIGVSVGINVPVEEVVFFVTHSHAPYVETKPLHHSQKIISKDHFGVTFSIQVQHNYELEKDILGLGEHIKILKPSRLKRKIKERINSCLEVYETEVDDRGLKSIKGKIEGKGYAILNHVFTQREIRRIRSLLDKFSDWPTIEKELVKLLKNHNLEKIFKVLDFGGIKKLESNLSFKKEKWHQHQENASDLRVILAIDNISTSKPLVSIFPGAHKKTLQTKEIKTIVENGIPVSCEFSSGGLFIYQSNLLKMYHKSAIDQNKRIRALEIILS
ncbi:MAG: WYL domain-containing protein, partial [Flavobacteriales bacterium]|nr:WYL domain-containing protein [Flavobacteriales bacterium]